MKQPTQQKTQDSSKQPHQSSVTTNQSLSQPLDQSHLKTAHPLSHPVSIPLNDRQDSPNTDNTDEEMIENAEDEKDQLVFSTDREGIKAAFTEINHQVNECYSAWLKENPSLEGRVVVSFSINPPQAPEEDENQRGTGEMETENSNQLERSQISNAELIVDDIAHPMMSGCILNSVEGMRFEAVEKPISIRYPYRFSAR